MLLRILRKLAWLLFIPLAVWCVWASADGAALLGLTLGFAPWALRARWRWRPTAALLLLPLLLGGPFLHAVWRYADGTAGFSYAGLPAPEFWNIDRETRLPRYSLGCTGGGPNPVAEDVSNATLKWLTRKYGLMRGVYDGPYPTASQSRARLNRDAQPVDLTGLKADRLKVGEETVTLSPPVAAEISADSVYAGRARACLVDKRLLILRVDQKTGGAEGHWPGHFQSRDITYLVDLKGWGVVARYVAEPTLTSAAEAFETELGFDLPALGSSVDEAQGIDDENAAARPQMRQRAR